MLDDNDEPVEVQGHPLTALDRFWLDTVRGAVGDSVGVLEAAAKQIITITTLLQAIYFAAISFSDLKEALFLQNLRIPNLATSISHDHLGEVPVQENTVGWMLVLLFVLPIVFWLLSLGFAVRVFKPEAYRTNLASPDVARRTYLKIVSYKHRQLQWAHRFLVMGILPLVVSITVYLAWV